MIGNHVAMLLRLITELLTGFAGEMTVAVVGLVFAWHWSGAVLDAPSTRKLNFGAVRAPRPRMTWLERHKPVGHLRARVGAGGGPSRA